MSKKKAIVWICAAALVVGLLPDAPADACTGKPFFMVARSTSSGFVPGVFPVIGTGYTESKGWATYVGMCTVTSTVTLTWTSDGVRFEGPTVLTARNGDTLTFQGTGSQDEDLRVQGTWQVTAGTGRYAGATGSGTMKGYWTDDGTAVTWATGRICLKDGDDDEDDDEDDDD